MNKIMSREIRASFTDTTIRVYQAYNDTITDAALLAQRFVSPWKVDRITWIKPSAVWMGYRSGWGKKDLNQKRILALDLDREMFDDLLRMAVPARMSHVKSLAIIQWDPERQLCGLLGKDSFTSIVEDVRSIQIGVQGLALVQDGLIKSIIDVTLLFNKIGELLEAGDVENAKLLLPSEEIYETG